MAHRYDAHIDLTRDDAHTRVVRLVGEHKRVLELGCATGYMSRVLAEVFACTVVGVERDPGAAEAARAACRRVIVGDLDTLDLGTELGDERFDVVVCADVLEHLRDPTRVLAALGPRLAADGYVVASIPNVAHASVIAELLEGRFPYRPLGLLDDTHIRFFTRESIYRCFEAAGLVIDHLERVRVAPEQTEFRTDLTRFPAELRERLLAGEESTTYQFVLRARPAPAGSGAVLGGGLTRALAEVADVTPAGSDEAGWRRDFRALVDALVARLAFVEDERRHQAGRLEELTRLTEERDRWRRDAEALARDRDDWREQCLGFARHAQSVAEETERLRGDAERARAELAASQSGVAWRLLSRYRRLRAAMLPPASRRSRLLALGPRAITREAARHVRLFYRAARAIHATQGSAEVWRQARAYFRPGPAEPPETLPTADLQTWFVRHGRPVSIIIPTYNQTTLVRRCVESLVQALPAAARDRVRIVVVDDGSPDAVQQALRDIPARLVARPVNEGFARTVNAGLELASGDDVVLLNNDTLAHPGWLEALQYCAYRQADVGILGPKLLYPDGRIQSAGSYRSVDQPHWFDHCYRFDPADHPPAQVERDVLAVTGACMYVKRAVLDRIGPLDATFAMAFEDVDYCLRARQAGFRVVYCPHATLTHLEGATRGERQEPRELRSQEYFWAKWGRHFDGRRVWTASPDSLAVVYVVQDTGVAGGHKVVFEHVNRLRERGHETELWALAGPPRWFPLRAPVRTFPSWEALAAELAQRDAVKVATWWKSADPVWRAALARGVPVYLVQDIETSYYDHQGAARPEHARVMASYRKEFHYLTDATWTQHQLAGLGLPATVVAPGIDQTIFRPRGLPRPSDVLLSVGRSHPLKNLDLLLRAVRLMERRAALHLFGVEPHVGKGTAARSVFNPTDEQVAVLYNTATVFVLTSVHEGYGLPILEAMACGCPVVTTDADGNMDFCRDGENCLIVPKDDPRHLAKTLDGLLGDPALQERLRQGGLATVQAYTWDRAIASLERFYRDIVRLRSALSGP